MIEASTALYVAILVWVWGFVAGLAFAQRIDVREVLRAYLGWCLDLWDRMSARASGLELLELQVSELQRERADLWERLRQHRSVIDRYQQRYGYLPPDLRPVVDGDDGGPDAA